jgi:hypothetical protein
MTSIQDAIAESIEREKAERHAALEQRLTNLELRAQALPALHSDAPVVAQDVEAVYRLFHRRLAWANFKLTFRTAPFTAVSTLIGILWRLYVKWQQEI